MENIVIPQVRAVLQYRKAESACHGARLDVAPEGAAHDFTCRQCGQPAERVLGEPAEVIAGSDA